MNCPSDCGACVFPGPYSRCVRRRRSYYKAFRSDHEQQQGARAAAGFLSNGNTNSNSEAQGTGVSSGDEEDLYPRVMALTFDDGPTETTANVLDLLKEYGAKATFFNIARNAHNPITARVLAEGQSSRGMHM